MHSSLSKLFIFYVSIYIFFIILPFYLLLVSCIINNYINSENTDVSKWIYFGQFYILLDGLFSSIRSELSNRFSPVKRENSTGKSTSINRNLSTGPWKEKFSPRPLKSKRTTDILTMKYHPTTANDLKQ